MYFRLGYSAFNVGKVERNAQPIVSLVDDDALKQTTDLDLDPKFFIDFAPQRLGMGFLGFDFAPRKFPKGGLWVLGGLFCDENGVRADLYNGSDNFYVTNLFIRILFPELHELRPVSSCQ
jgi:hypothetical protein